MPPRAIRTAAHFGRLRSDICSANPRTRAEAAVLSRPNASLGPRKSNALAPRTRWKTDDRATEYRGVRPALAAACACFCLALDISSGPDAVLRCSTTPVTAVNSRQNYGAPSPKQTEMLHTVVYGQPPTGAMNAPSWVSEPKGSCHETAANYPPMAFAARRMLILECCPSLAVYAAPNFCKFVLRRLEEFTRICGTAAHHWHSYNRRPVPRDVLERQFYGTSMQRL